MKFIGRLACLVAILGLFSQLVEARPVLANDPTVAAKCGGDSPDSHCPMEPLHDHCVSYCGHVFNIIPGFAEAFQVRVSGAMTWLMVRQESAPEGFPAGLFIPPRLS